MAAAGFIYSSVNDMMKYMRLLLHDGIFEKDTFVTKSVINEILKPQIIFPLFDPPVHNEFTSYGLGWWVTLKNGHKIIEHSGGIDGMAANLVMINDLDVGIIVLTNTDEFVPFLLTFKLLEQIFDDKSYDLYSYLKKLRATSITDKKENKEKLNKSRIKDTKPSLDLKLYAGTYNDNMYGNILIKYNEGNLEINFSHTPLFSGKLKHWHYDTFLIDWYDVRVPDGLLTFNFDAERKIIGITLNQQNLLDVDFSELEIKKIFSNN